MTSAGIILCAGLSSRMKDFKPLLPMDGRTLIECTIDSMVQGGVERIVLVLGHRGKDIEAVLHRSYPLKKAGLKMVYNPRFADSDMMESVRIGLSKVLNWPADQAPVESVFVLPGDMPKIHPQTYTTMMGYMGTHSCMVLIPSYRGENAHPPLIRADCLDYLIKYNEPGGLKAALSAFLPDTAYLSVDDRGCTLDADYPDDYVQLLNYQACPDRG